MNVWERKWAFIQKFYKCTKKIFLKLEFTEILHAQQTCRRGQAPTTLRRYFYLHILYILCSINNNTILLIRLISRYISNFSGNLQHKQSTDGNNGSVTQRKLFECDVCNMKFSNGANMRRHKMRHTGVKVGLQSHVNFIVSYTITFSVFIVKPYECRVCQKRFFRKDHLAEHFTTHTKSLPFHW